MPHTFTRDSDLQDAQLLYLQSIARRLPGREDLPAAEFADHVTEAARRTGTTFTVRPLSAVADDLSNAAVRAARVAVDARVGCHDDAGGLDAALEAAIAAAALLWHAARRLNGDGR